MLDLQDDIVAYSCVIMPRHNASLTSWRCGLLSCYCPDTLQALLDDVVAYSPVTAKTQCKPY